MESISKRTGKVFIGRFAETAARIGLAKPVEGSLGKAPKKTVKKAPKKTKK